MVRRQNRGSGQLWTKGGSKWRRNRRRNSRWRRLWGPCMRILFTADLHLLRATQERTLLMVRKWIMLYRPDAFVVAGDMSSSQQAEDTLRNLRSCFPKGPIAVCLGNHDF